MLLVMSLLHTEQKNVSEQKHKHTWLIEHIPKRCFSRQGPHLFSVWLPSLSPGKSKFDPVDSNGPPRDDLPENFCCSIIPSDSPSSSLLSNKHSTLDLQINTTLFDNLAISATRNLSMKSYY